MNGTIHVQPAGRRIGPGSMALHTRAQGRGYRGHDRSYHESTFVYTDSSSSCDLRLPRTQRSRNHGCSKLTLVDQWPRAKESRANKHPVRCRMTRYSIAAAGSSQFWYAQERCGIAVLCGGREAVANCAKTYLSLCEPLLPGSHPLMGIFLHLPVPRLPYGSCPPQTQNA